MIVKVRVREYGSVILDDDGRNNKEWMNVRDLWRYNCEDSVLIVHGNSDKP